MTLEEENAILVAAGPSLEECGKHMEAGRWEEARQAWQRHREIMAPLRALYA